MRKNNIVRKLSNLIVLVTIFLSIDAKSQVYNKRSLYSISDNYYPTGWMGDGEFGEKNLYFINNWKDTTRPDLLCNKIVYHKQEPIGWAGIYWQNLPNNWGENPGNNFSKVGYTKLTFWARGEKGGEVVKFKVGGISSRYRPYRDASSTTIGYVVLQRQWKQYTINLKDKDLSSVIGGFCWIIDDHGNTNELITLTLEDGKKHTFWTRQKKIIFYLDDIQLE